MSTVTDASKARSSVSDITTVDELRKVIQPTLEAMAADTNVQGSAQKAVGPLLEGLPPGAVLTGKTIDKMNLDEHARAYLLFECWCRAAFVSMDHGLARAQNIAQVLDLAEQSPNANELQPTWLKSPRDFIVFSDHKTAASAGSWKIDNTRLDQVRSFNEPHLKRYGEDVHLSLNARLDSVNVVGLTFKFKSPNWVIQESPARELADLPTYLLVLLQEKLRSFTPAGTTGFLAQMRDRVREGDGDIAAAQKIVNAIDKVLEARAEPTVAQIRKALVDFGVGALDSLTGSVPKTVIDAVARQVGDVEKKRS
jgi:hypothetical protein